MPEASHTIAGYPASTVPSSARYQWMDISRGLGVMLIVVVHAGSIFSGVSGTDVPGWIRALDLALAPYRIPLLIFLSGILLSRSLAKGSERFITGKLKHLGWPFLIWTAITVLASTGPEGWLNIRPWLGGTTLWYLSFLGFYYAIGLLFARVPVLVIAAYALAIAMVAPDDTRYGSRLFLMMSYFFVGAYGGQQLDKFTAAIRSRWILALLPLVLALAVFFTTQDAYFKYAPGIAPLVIGSIICVCGVINMFASGWVASAFQFAGRNSLIYYVVHVPLYFVLYDILFAWDVRSAYACIGLALALGITVPTLLAHAKGRSRAVRLLFEGPDFRVGPALSRLAAGLDRVLLAGYRPARENALAGAAKTFDKSS